MIELEKLQELSVPGPTVTAVTKPFWDGAARGELLIQKCLDCEGHVFYPRTHCTHCWSPELKWVRASGKARLKTYSVVYRPGHPGWQDVTPFPLGIVELEEGPTLLTQLLGKREEFKAGDELHVRFVEVNGVRLPFFE